MEAEQKQALIEEVESLSPEQQENVREYVRRLRAAGDKWE